MGGSTNMGMLLRAQEARIILIGKCGCAKKVGQKQNMDSMWKTRHKDVDLEDPTSVDRLLYLGCTQGDAKVDPQAHQSAVQEIDEDKGG